MGCRKHASAGAGPLCPLCLLEQALLAQDETPPRRLTICVPLGIAATQSVYLVRQDAPASGLMRLKTWHRPAPADYLDRFQALRDRLLDSGCEFAVPPIAAAVSAHGWPSVLSEFRRGVPVLDAVTSGLLPSSDARPLIETLAGQLDDAHRRGLVHGSPAAGNVMVRPDRSALFLVDFGLAALLSGPGETHFSADHDRATLAALGRAVTSAPIS